MEALFQSSIGVSLYRPASDWLGTWQAVSDNMQQRNAFLLGSSISYRIELIFPIPTPLLFIVIP